MVAVGEKELEQRQLSQRRRQRDESVAADAERAQAEKVAHFIWQLL